MLQRPISRANGAAGPMTGGNRLFDGRQLMAVDGANQAIPVAALIAGIVNRTGSGGATGDSLPTVDSIIAAIPELNRGDSIGFQIRMPDANAITLTVGAGMTAVGTVNVAASNIREYLLTLTSGASRTRVCSGSISTVAALVKTISNLTAADLAAISVGMAVTGTGIGAAAKVTAVNQTAGTVLVSVDSTATADNVAITFTPQADLLGVGTRAI